MNRVLSRLLAGEITEAEAEAELRLVQLEELEGAARLDLGRSVRRGLPEVVLAAGKSPAEVARLAVVLAQEQGQGLVSRVSAEHRAAIDCGAAEAGLQVEHRRACVRLVRPGFVPPAQGGRVGLLTAGTSDLEVAEEALMMIEACGLDHRWAADVGVAGLHRLMRPLHEMLLWNPDVLIVAAGMDGVLPGVVAALVAVPTIGLPISTGYGVGGQGKGALVTMLQSCATGLLVVNVDNGIGAGAAAVLIAAGVGRTRQAQPAPARRRSAASGPRSRPAAPSD
ncbi:MAG TPA: nickel pincer cofactor biosynthesis protein LarB [Candidatus Acidoferrales bacterium]|nr:nickel pincer cofactor biosynthesis protein LarB [Candidatus Acidoferrales bacterium]